LLGGKLGWVLEPHLQHFFGASITRSYFCLSACALVQFDPAVVEGAATWKMDPSIRDSLQDLVSRQLAIQIRGT
jgi:hypothetical protein